MEIRTRGITETYSKLVMLSQLERARMQISKAKMADICGVSPPTITSFEDLRVVNLHVLDEYIKMLGIKFRAEFKKSDYE